MSPSFATTLRWDLVRRYWRLYVAVSAAALAIHMLWLWRSGIAGSTDYGVRYSPAAQTLLMLLGIWHDAAPASVGAYGWSHIGYISFVAFCFAMAGTANLKAVVYTQVAIVWLVYPLVFHILMHLTRRPALSLGAIAVWLSFMDSYQWHFWGLPDSLFRLMFLTSFFLLLRLWQTGQQKLFALVTIFCVPVCTVFRIETPLYALPAVGLMVRGVLRRGRATTVIVVSVAAILLWAGRHFLGVIAADFVGLQTQGFVLPGSGQHVPGLTELQAPEQQGALAWTLFFLHLMVARAWYAVTPLPALWSRFHRLYYAAYMVPAYVFGVCGFAAAVRKRDYPVILCGWVFAAGILLQMLVAVDPSMRYAYTPHVFLFLSAVAGWQALFLERSHVIERDPIRVDA